MHNPSNRIAHTRAGLVRLAQKTMCPQPCGNRSTVTPASVHFVESASAPEKWWSFPHFNVWRVTHSDDEEALSHWDELVEEFVHTFSKGLRSRLRTSGVDKKLAACR